MGIREPPLEALAMTLRSGFWKNRRVLLTGHTGFKGVWLGLWLSRLGAQVTGIALPPDNEPNLFRLIALNEYLQSHFCDIRDLSTLTALVAESDPEIVFHLAAQPLVLKSYRDPILTFNTNIMGTANLLEALRSAPRLQAVVVVTTDKVYENLETLHAYHETDALGGHDPYSASKAACEVVTTSYRKSFYAERNVAISTARAGNVIGGGDWSDDRLIPDAVRKWEAGETLHLRHPEAIRPWQHVLEPLSGYLALAEKTCHTPSLAGAYNFGPGIEDSASVCTVIDAAQLAYGAGAIRFGSEEHTPHEADILRLDNSKASKVLGVTPRWGLSEAISRTMHWYREWHRGANPLQLCEHDIVAFEDGS